MTEKNRTVWSSTQGDLRGKETAVHQIPSPPPSGQTVYLHRESKGRGGKSATLVKNLILSTEDMKEMTKRLKQLCGTGGTVKGGVIEIQGEHREKIADMLKGMGYRVIIAGG